MHQINKVNQINITNTVPLLYHPTTVVFLNDDLHFLKALQPHIDPHYRVMLRTQIMDALDYLKTHCFDSRALINDTIRPDLNSVPSSLDGFQEQRYYYNFSGVQGNLQSVKRFEKVHVAVIDQQMSNMEGLAVCRLLRQSLHLPLKLILLTGANCCIDEMAAAFNEGLIDAFIPKYPREEMLRALHSKITQFTDAQFKTFAQASVGMVLHDMDHLYDSDFLEVFACIRLAKKIVEFYLFDSCGSFLMLNRQGNAHLLVVRPSEEFNIAYELAENSDASSGVLQSLRDRSAFPCRHAGMTHPPLLTGLAWTHAMCPMKRIAAKDIFYTVLDLPDQQAVGFSDLISSMVL